MKKQKTFFDEELRLDKLEKKRDPLLKLKNSVNWEIFRTVLEGAFKKESSGPGGRPRYDLVMMLKIIILQRLYNISDEQVEFQINDRLSFMRFLDLGLEDDIPDQNTIWLFRETLIKKGKIKKLFNKFNNHLRSNRIIAKEGSILDASFIDIPVQRNTKEENNEIKKGYIPSKWSGKKKSHKDTDAKWMTKNGEKHFGYKDHIKAGVKSKIIKNYTITPANVHDSQAIDDLLTTEDSHHDLFGDSAYSGEPIKKKLKRRKIRNRIHEKSYRNHFMTAAQLLKNRTKSRIRVYVEHVFGFMENSMNGMFIKSVGQKRAEGIIGLMNITYNIMRSIQLERVKYA